MNTLVPLFGDALAAAKDPATTLRCDPPDDADCKPLPKIKPPAATTAAVRCPKLIDAPQFRPTHATPVACQPDDIRNPVKLQREQGL